VGKRVRGWVEWVEQGGAKVLGVKPTYDRPVRLILMKAVAALANCFHLMGEGHALMRGRLANEAP